MLLNFQRKIKKDQYAHPFQNKVFGLFLGDTDFSKIVLKKVKKLNKNYFIIDFSKNNKFVKEKNSHRISIGKFGKIINLIKEKKSNKVLFAGKIAKPKFCLLYTSDAADE